MTGHIFLIVWIPIGTILLFGLVLAHCRQVGFSWLQSAGMALATITGIFMMVTSFALLIDAMNAA